MAIAQLRARSFAPDPVDTDLRSVPDGGLVVGDWIDALVARGYGWHTTIGAFSTPITGGGNGTILDIDQPEGIVSVPTGWTMRPIRIHVQCQPPLGASDSDETEILIALDPGAASRLDGTTTTEDVFNLRTDRVGGSPVSVRSAATADVSRDDGAGLTNDPDLDIELSRRVKVYDTKTDVGVVWNDLDLLYEPRYPPFVVGPGCIYLYWGGTVATTGFAQVQFVAFPSSKVTNLS